MKPEDTLWRQVFTVAGRAPIEPPSSDLEERVMAEWKQSDRRGAIASDVFREVRWALLGACAVLMVTCAIAVPILKAPYDPSVLLTNSAIQSGLNHE
ncbi:hypothetical protein BH09VER1_BH09VER1_07140 [soil metagenome]